MINVLKEATQKLVSDLKKDVNEIKKTMQYMNEEINKDLEILKNNQSEMNSSISPIKFKSKTCKQSEASCKYSIRKRRQRELDQTVK
jgi:hypothetical protein